MNINYRCVDRQLRNYESSSMPTSSNKCVVCGGLRLMPTRLCASAICQAKYRDHIRQGGRVCVICGTPLSKAQGNVEGTCNSVDCRIQAQGRLTSNSARCSICGIGVPFAMQVTGVCDEPVCRQQATGHRAAEQAKRLLEKRERLEALAVATYRCSPPTETSTGLESDEPIPIVVPANLRPLTTPPLERVASLRQNLRRLAEAVVTEANDQAATTQHLLAATANRESQEALEAEQADTTYDILVGRACGTCLGFCCFAGGEHAFLKHSDLRRAMYDNQLTEVNSLVELFLSYIPEQSVENSCLYHGKAGCGMPRRMRSDMCNTTLCPSLVNLYQKSVGQSFSQPYLFASTNLEDDIEREPRVFQIRIASALRTPT